MSTWEERMSANAIQRRRAYLDALECTCPPKGESGSCEKHGVRTSVTQTVEPEGGWPPDLEEPPGGWPPVPMAAS